MPVKMNDWPMAHEYDEAMMNRRRAFRDFTLQNGYLWEVSPGQPMRLNAGGSQHICVYRIADCVVRCFASDPPANVYPPADIVPRYRGITAYLKRSSDSLPFLVTYDLIEEPGVNVKGAHFPYLKLPYIINSRPLGDFLSEHYANRQAVGTIARQWTELIQKMEEQNVAHGDLDLSNVLVRGKYPLLSLHLIDFDGMYIPDFARANMSVTDNGHIHFQPALSSMRTFGPTMDRFSALVIYLSLSALEINPSLWEQCEASDRNLLLWGDDFQRLGQSVRFPLLRKEQNNKHLQLCLDELQEAINQGKMPRSLKDILQEPSSFDKARESDYVVIGQTSPSTYEGRSVEIPLEESPVTTSPQRTEASSSPFSSSAPGPQSNQISGTRLATKQTTSSPTSSSKAWKIAFLIIILVGIAALIIWAIIYAQQSSQSTSSVLFLMLLQFFPKRSVDLSRRSIYGGANVDDEA